MQITFQKHDTLLLAFKALPSSCTFTLPQMIAGTSVLRQRPEWSGAAAGRLPGDPCLAFFLGRLWGDRLRSASNSALVSLEERSDSAASRVRRRMRVATTHISAILCVSFCTLFRPLRNHHVQFTLQSCLTSSETGRHQLVASSQM